MNEGSDEDANTGGIRGRQKESQDADLLSDEDQLPIFTRRSKMRIGQSLGSLVERRGSSYSLSRPHFQHQRRLSLAPPLTRTRKFSLFSFNQVTSKNKLINNQTSLY